MFTSSTIGQKSMLTAFFQKMKFSRFKFKNSYFRHQIFPLVFKLQKLPTTNPLSLQGVSNISWPHKLKTGAYSLFVKPLTYNCLVPLSPSRIAKTTLRNVPNRQATAQFHFHRAASYNPFSFCNDPFTFCRTFYQQFNIIEKTAGLTPKIPSRSTRYFRWLTHFCNETFYQQFNIIAKTTGLTPTWLCLLFMYLTQP